MDKMEIYNKLPVFAQNMACYYEGKKIKKNRYGKDFWDLLKNYESRNNWTYDQLCEYRDDRLRQMVEHCYETVPYYKRLFDDLGISYKDINTIEDLKLLPVLTKQIVNENFNAFISTTIPFKKMVTSHTSGTTGSGFKFYTTNETLCEQWAVWWRYRRNLGINFDDWCALFGSKLIVPVTQKKPPYWRINEPCKQVYFSAFHENPEYLYYYYKEIKRRKLKWLHGFPSLITLFASFMVENNLELGYDMKFVTTGAENLLGYQRNIIEKAFGTKVFQHYGLAEGVSNFSQDVSGTMCVDEDFAVTEFVPNDGNFDIIGTSLSNLAMPLIRFETGDKATFVYDEKNQKRIIYTLGGRIEDYITLRNGVKIGKLDHAFKDTINIKEAQIYQKSNYDIIIYVVKCKADISKDENVASKLLRMSWGNDINFEFKHVEEIPRLKGGKLKFVISDVL